MSNFVDLPSLVELGEPEFVDEMIDLFSALSTELRQELRVAIDTSAAVTTARAAHKLRGACLAMFAGTAAELAGTLERAGVESQLASAPEILRQLEVALGESLREMQTVRSAAAHP